MWLSRTIGLAVSPPRPRKRPIRMGFSGSGAMICVTISAARSSACKNAAASTVRPGGLVVSMRMYAASNAAACALTWSQSGSLAPDWFAASTSQAPASAAAARCAVIDGSLQT